MKILLVDDDAFLLDMYAAKFTAAGHEIETAQSVEETLQKLRDAADVDVVVLDMVLSGKTGLDLLQHMQHEGLTKVKAIVLSNQSDEKDVRAATAAGAVGYIVKAQLVPSEVVAEVERLAGASLQRSEV